MRIDTYLGGGGALRLAQRNTHRMLTSTPAHTHSHIAMQTSLSRSFGVCKCDRTTPQPFALLQPNPKDVEWDFDG